MHVEHSIKESYIVFVHLYVLAEVISNRFTLLVQQIDDISTV